MIILGYQDKQKIDAINKYSIKHNINKIFILSPEKFYFKYDNGEFISYPNIIRYKFFYRLLQEIDNRSLIIINECLRTQNRNDLTCNCIRHFLNQAKHQIIFQNIPIIDSIEDFMILFDFDTKSKWKREKFDIDLLNECELLYNEVSIKINPILIDTPSLLIDQYEKEKDRLIENIGNKDPHTIPRNLYLMSGKLKKTKLSPNKFYVGRNNRFKIPKMQKYKEAKYLNKPYMIFELPHNFIDFIDFVSLSDQLAFEILMTDLKIDQWYINRYLEWIKRINDFYEKIKTSLS